MPNKCKDEDIFDQVDVDFGVVFWPSQLSVKWLHIVLDSVVQSEDVAGNVLLLRGLGEAEEVG